jgi:hypothetical protein
MSIVDEVRRALQPLIDQGIVHSVQHGAFATYGKGSLSGEHEPVTVLVNTTDLEPHRVDIKKLILQAGLKVDLQLHSKPSR